MGGSATPLASWYQRKTEQAVLSEEQAGTASDLFTDDADDSPLISPSNLADLIASDRPLVILDVRTRSQYIREDGMIPGSIRVESGNIVDWIRDQASADTVVAYCT